MPFPITVEALDLEDVLLFLIDNVDVSTCCKKVMATTRLVLLAPKTSLVILVLLANLEVVGRRLMHAIRCVSKKIISGFSVSGVLFLFVCRPIPLKTS